MFKKDDVKIVGFDSDAELLLFEGIPPSELSGQPRFDQALLNKAPYDQFDVRYKFYASTSQLVRHVHAGVCDMGWNPCTMTSGRGNCDPEVCLKPTQCQFDWASTGDASACPTTNRTDTGEAKTRPCALRLRSDGKTGDDCDAIDALGLGADKEWAEELKRADPNGDAYVNVAKNDFEAQIDQMYGACCVGFARPYMRTGVSLVGKKIVAPPKASVLTKLFSPLVVNALCVLMITLIGAGHLIWFAEHKANSEEFPTGYLDGIDDSVWWAAVTVTSVGYGDKVPISVLGRAIAFAWMVIGMVIAAYLTGIISSGLTSDAVTQVVRELSGSLKEFQAKKVCSTGFYTRGYLKSSTVVPYPPEGANTMNACMDLLAAGKVDAVLYDKPMIEHYMKKNQKTDWELGKDWVAAIDLSPVFPISCAGGPGSACPPSGGAAPGVTASPGCVSRRPHEDLRSFRKDFDVRISLLFEGGYLSALEKLWFQTSVEGGSADGDDGAEEESYDWSIVATTLALMGTYSGIHFMQACRKHNTKENRKDMFERARRHTKTMIRYTTSEGRRKNKEERDALAEDADAKEKEAQGEAESGAPVNAAQIANLVADRLDAMVERRVAEALSRHTGGRAESAGGGGKLQGETVVV